MPHAGNNHFAWILGSNAYFCLIKFPPRRIFPLRRCWSWAQQDYPICAPDLREANANRWTTTKVSLPDLPAWLLRRPGILFCCSSFLSWPVSGKESWFLGIKVKEVWWMRVWSSYDGWMLWLLPGNSVACFIPDLLYCFIVSVDWLVDWLIQGEMADFSVCFNLSFFPYHYSIPHCPLFSLRLFTTRA